MLGKLARPFKPLLEAIAQTEARISLAWTAAAHRRLMRVQWKLPPVPEHMDHHIDVFYQFRAQRNSLWAERGVFGGLALQGGDVLELSCGDGFNACNFYSLRSRRVIACDFDPRAIKTAIRKNGAPNVTYVLADIRTDMPAGKFSTVVWDAAIEHFTQEETTKIIRDIRTRLTDGGILTGYTIVALEGGEKMLVHHEYEFKSKDDLADFLAPHFRNVTVFETAFPMRRNLYFWASDGPLPLTPGWPDVTARSRT
ncbi:MAG: hypothetical protein JWM32_128 [Verrucomicrobia bacterium]|nr:hypothetical protein [Verrucomicrobiota bacterium]